MCRFGCVDWWVSCIFHCICCCVYHTKDLHPISIVLSYNSIYIVFFYPNSATLSFPTIMYSIMMQQTFCAYHVCIFYMIHQYHIQYTLIRPNHTGYAAVFDLMYLMMIVACYLCCSTSIVPSRVVSRSNIRIIRKFKEVVCGIDAALHLKYRRYDTIIWRFSNTYSLRASRRLSIR